jgi:hypothetical protein
MANQKQQQRPGQPGREGEGGERREAPGGERSPAPEREDEPVKRGQGREADPDAELEEGDRVERELDDEGDLD